MLDKWRDRQVDMVRIVGAFCDYAYMPKKEIQWGTRNVLIFNSVQSVIIT